MNSIAVLNPCHKCDLENKNDSVTDKKITADNIILTVIIIFIRYIYIYIYICVCVCVCLCFATYTPNPTKST